MTEEPARAQTDPATALLEKLRDFAAGLAPAERQALAVLLAPGVAAAWQDDTEVAGFAWHPDDLQGHVNAAVRAHDIRIVGW